MASNENTINNTLVSDTWFPNTIINKGYNVTIDAGERDNSITNYGANSSISGGDGNDTLINKTSYPGTKESIVSETIQVEQTIYKEEKYQDTVKTTETIAVEVPAHYERQYVYGGQYYHTDHSYIKAPSSGYYNVWVYDGWKDEEKEVIKTVTKTRKVPVGTKMVDSVVSHTVNVPTTIKTNNTGSTLLGGAGNDSIVNEAANFVYVYTNGDDTIQGFSDTSTLKIFSDNIDKTTLSGNDILIMVGENTISLKDGVSSASKLNIVDGDNNPITVNLELNGTDTADSIINALDDVKINSSGGDDNITNSGTNVTIYGGDGNDTINNKRQYSTIDGGDGDDYIQNLGVSSTIDGGAGNDYISLNSSASNNLINYNAGDGNDTIKGFNDTSTLQILSGTIESAYTNGVNTFLQIGENVITINGKKESIKVMDAAGEIEVLAAIDKIIKGTEEADTLKEGLANYLIQGLGGNDSIYNEGDSVTIDGGVGNDSIRNGESYYFGGGSHVSISGSEGDDYIQNWGVSSTIDGGDDDDYIENMCESSSISGGSGNDTIFSRGDSVTIDGGAGNDYIQNGKLYSGVGGGSHVSISGGAGDDYIQNGGVSSTIDGGDDDDYIENTCEGSSISGGSGNDTIFSRGDSVTIDGGAGNDYIQNGKLYSGVGGDSHVSISGGAGDDYIYNIGDNVTFKYASGDGNDTIDGFNDTSNLQILSGTIESAYTNGVNTFLQIGENVITINGKKESLKVMDAAGEIEVLAAIDKIIKGTEEADTLKGLANYLIQGLGGNDYISNYGGQSVIINAGEGDDTILNEIRNEYNWDKQEWEVNSPDNMTINGGAGNDSIYNRGNNVTFKYASGDGNDTIDGFNDTSNLQILSGTIESAYTNGVNTFLQIGENVITINGEKKSLKVMDAVGEIEVLAAIDKIIKGTEEADTLYSQANYLIQGLGGNDSIENLGESSTIDGGAGDDYISLNSSASNNLINYNAGDGNDTIDGFNDTSTLQILSGTIESAYTNGVNTFLQIGENVITINGEKKSIKVMDATGEIEVLAIDKIIKGTEEADTLYGQANYLIQGLGGNDSISNTSDFVTIDGGDDDDYIYNVGKGSSISGGSGNDTIENWVESSTLDGGAGNDYIKNVAAKNFVYQYAEGNDTIVGFNENSTLQISDGIEISSVKSGANIIVTVGDGSITLVDAADLFVIAETVPADTVPANTIPADTAPAETIIIDNLSDSKVTLNDAVKIADATKYKKPIQITGNALDNIIYGGKSNDTLDGAGGNNTLTGGKGNDLFIYSGGKEVITDYDKKDKISTGEFTYNDFAVDGKDLIFHFGDDNSLTIQKVAGKQINLNDNVNYYTADGVLDKKKKSITLLATTESFTTDSKVETIDGTATGAIEITGNKKKNLIYAGANGSTLNGVKANDTLVGGAGADVFVYENKSGKDIIENFGDGDSIDLDSSVTIKDVKTKRGDTVLKFKGGALTVKDTTEFNIGDTLYSNGVFVAGDSAKIYGSYKGAINLADNVNNFDGSEGKKKLTITGNDSANSLVGGKGKDSLTGGAGDDTLYGGKGNDKLWGGNGADNFIFQAGNGKDMIMDYSAAQGDLLTILNKRGEAGDFKKATLKDDTLTLAIDGGGKVIFSGVDSDTSININGETKTISELIK